MVNVVVHPEDSDRATFKETIGVTEDRSGGQRLAIKRLRRPKKWTQGNDKSWQKLVAAHERLTRHTDPARCKG
jgi:hypothetical protein